MQEKGIRKARASGGSSSAAATSRAIWSVWIQPSNMGPAFERWALLTGTHGSPSRRSQKQGRNGRQPSSRRTSPAGRGSDANERSLALGINYDLAQLSIGEAERIGLSGWMLAVAGVRVPSNIDSLIQAADGSASAPPPARDALLLLLGSPEAALWILKRKILAGKKTDADKDSVAPSVWAQAQAFQAEYALMNGYVAAAEKGALQYGAQSTGSDLFGSAVNAGALASMKAWQDPVFAPSVDATANDIISRAAEIESARSKTALDYVAEILGDEITAMTRARQGLTARLIFEKQSEELGAGLASSPLAYRAYLSDSLMKVTGDSAADIAEQALAPTTTAARAASQVDDASGIYSVAPEGTGSGTPGPFYENTLLEASNQFRVQAERFNTTVAATTSLDRSRLGDYSNAFSPIFIDATNGKPSALLAEWDGIHLDGFDITGAGKEAVVSSQRTLNEAQVSTSSLKQRIALLGSALFQRLSNEHASTAAATAPLQQEVDRLVKERDSLDHAYSAAVTAFETTSGRYDGLFDTARTSATELEASRFELQKAEAISIFASTGYLNPTTGEVTSSAGASDGEDAMSLAVDPDQRLTAARAGLLRARAALDALRSLYGDADQPADFAQGSSPEQAAYRNSFDQYQKQYAAYLAMERLSSLLSSATAKQREKVTAAQEALDKNVCELLADAPGTVEFADADGKSTTKAYVQVTFSGSGLPDFSFGSASSAAQETYLSDYLTGKLTSSYAADRETWVKEISSFIKAHGTDFVTDWSLAFQHQMSSLNLSGSSDEHYKELFSGYLVDKSTVIGSNPVPATERVDYTVEFADKASSAYNKVMSDPAQKSSTSFSLR